MNFIDALAAVNLDTTVYQTYKERRRDVARRVLVLNRTIRVEAELTEMKRLRVAALQLMLTFGKGCRCFFDERKRYWWAGCPPFLAWQVGLLKSPLGGVIEYIYHDLVDK